MRDQIVNISGFVGLMSPSYILVFTQTIENANYYYYFLETQR